MLFESGSIRKLGRVDHRDTFLDTEELERLRGITIFSKQAQLKIGRKNVCLLDTPGHVDFSAEMERTLQVLDYAVLVISGADGVQGHTRTLWRLLKRYSIPVFVFINKMDQQGTDKAVLLKEVQEKLDASCIDFSDYAAESSSFYDAAAMCDEGLMDLFLEKGFIPKEELSTAIGRRVVFPCFFGSALKQEGVRELMDALDCFMAGRDYGDEFGARVFKIAHDEQNNRITYAKITGGSLKVKSVVSGGDWEEKADQIRIYSGSQYQVVSEAKAGEVCAITGLSRTFAGEGLGAEGEPELPVLEPVLTYKVILPEGCNVHDFYRKLCGLEEEEPELHIVWDEQSGEIHVQVMGEVQIEILKSLIAKRYQVDAAFGAGSIVYKETIAEPVVGIGHFEPLRHYAEVHLLMEPLERGSGLEFVTKCPEDVLDRNWQRLILTHLEEKKHRGVLMGAQITDMRISLITGRAHQKHTEGGDFRQATYRAVRNGLRKAKSILLEPFYEFRLELPQEMVGRGMADLQLRSAKFGPPVTEGGMVVLSGTAPVAMMRDYQAELVAYSRGLGRLFCSYKGYDVCHNADEVIKETGYDPEGDVENPTGSVFCAHGTGFYVEWDQVEGYAHVENGMAGKKNEEENTDLNGQGRKKPESDYGSTVIAQEEIEEIFARTFGGMKQRRAKWAKTITPSEAENYRGTEKPYRQEEGKTEYLLVDGYNMIFAWDELKKLAEVNIDSARDRLMDILCNYQGYRQANVILVFDAYKVHGGQETVTAYHNIHVVYTREAETADQYIEKVTNEIGRKYHVTVATSDRLEQMIVWGQGARRLSAPGLWEEIERVNKEIGERVEKHNLANGRGKGNGLSGKLPKPEDLE